MKYLLIGHDKGTAVQDTLICLLPEEQHIRVYEEQSDDCITVSLDFCDNSWRAKATLLRGGVAYETSKNISTRRKSEEKIKWEQVRAIKTAVYQAVCKILPQKPVWGAQTGVKPAKLIRFEMQNGMSEKQADSYMKKDFFISKSRRDLCIKCAKTANACEALLKPREVQIYIGIAFCPAKCSYCSFVSNSVQKMGHLVEPYVDAVISEIIAVGECIANNNLVVGSIYIGGGTPSVLSESQMERMLAAVDDNIPRENLREYSLEAGRPETITHEKLVIMKNHGVTRISINPQSMKDNILRNVGRLHTAQDVIDKYEMARQVGGFIINMDLIAGLPGDDEKGLLFSTNELIKLAPENITIHSLARKKGAAVIFSNHYDLSAKTLDKAHKMLYSSGYQPYYIYRQKYIAGGLENTGFSKGDTLSFYNVAMMEEMSTVIAIGAGGISKILDCGGQKLSRIANPKYPKEYIEGIDKIIDTKKSLIIT